MNVQRKRISTGKTGSSITEDATIVIQFNFNDAPSVNVHGLHVDISMTPFGPDESLEGRWYVVALPQSIVHDATVLTAWVDNLNTIASANTALQSSEFVWGSGAFICAEQAPFNTHFAPKTSRNMQDGSALFVIVVADAVSGVVDNWDASTHISAFVSS